MSRKSLRKNMNAFIKGGLTIAVVAAIVDFLVDKAIVSAAINPYIVWPVSMVQKYIPGVVGLEDKVGGYWFMLLVWFVLGGLVWFLIRKIFGGNGYMSFS